MKNPFRLCRHGLLGALLMLGMVMSGRAAVEFAMPGEGPAPFRRDRLPLPATLQSELATALIDLGRTMPRESAEQRRATAQTFALALALDPGKFEAREALESLAAGKPLPQPASPPAEGKGPVNPRPRVWRVLDALAAAPSQESNTLLICLRDIMAVADPEDERSKAWMDGKPDDLVWQGWVPPLERYESQEAPPAASSPVENPPEAPPSAPELKLTKATASTLIFEQDPKSRLPKVVTATFSMTAEPANQFSLQAAFADWLPQLLPVLGKKYPDLPPYQLTFTTKGSRRPPARAQSSAALLVLADAALSGNAPAAIVLGEITGTGAYQLPPDLWSCLKELAENPKGGRVIMPTAAADYLAGLLVLEKPGFFLKYEVILASNTTELLARASENPADEATAAMHRRFGVLMQAGGDVPATRFLANGSVRQQLEEIGRAFPWHASARLLALQAAGLRPRYLPRKALASSIQNALSSMKWVMEATYTPSSDELDRLEDAYNTSRAALAEIEKYADGPDRDLLKQAEEMVAKLRALTRAYKSKDVDYYGTSAITRVFEEFSAASKAFKTNLETVKNSR